MIHAQAVTAPDTAISAPPLTRDEMATVPYAGGDFVAELPAETLEDAFGAFAPWRLAHYRLTQVRVELPCDDLSGHYHAATYKIDRDAITLLDLRTMIRLTAALAIHSARHDDADYAETLTTLRDHNLRHLYVPAIPDGFETWAGTQILFDPESGLLTARIHPEISAQFTKVGRTHIEPAGNGWQLVFTAHAPGYHRDVTARYRLPAGTTARGADTMASVLDAAGAVRVLGRPDPTQRGFDLTVTQITMDIAEDTEDR